MVLTEGGTIGPTLSGLKVDELMKQEKDGGMTKGNQADPSTNGQYRVVGDMLGSTTLILSAVPGQAPTVVYRGYYKPYGEVAFQTGSSITSKGYTGQRADRESGLMYYGARYYDPALSYFISADAVVSGPGPSRSVQGRWQ